MFSRHVIEWVDVFIFSKKLGTWWPQIQRIPEDCGYCGSGQRASGGTSQISFPEHVCNWVETWNEDFTWFHQISPTKMCSKSQGTTERYTFQHATQNGHNVAWSTTLDHLNLRAFREGRTKSWTWFLLHVAWGGVSSCQVKDPRLSPCPRQGCPVTCSMQRSMWNLDEFWGSTDPADLLKTSMWQTKDTWILDLWRPGRRGLLSMLSMLSCLSCLLFHVHHVHYVRQWDVANLRQDPGVPILQGCENATGELGSSARSARVSEELSLNIFKTRHGEMNGEIQKHDLFNWYNGIE